MKKISTRMIETLNFYLNLLYHVESFNKAVNFCIHSHWRIRTNNLCFFLPIICRLLILLSHAICNSSNFSGPEADLTRKTFIVIFHKYKLLIEGQNLLSLLQLAFIIFEVVWRGIHFGSDTDRIEVKG